MTDNKKDILMEKLIRALDFAHSNHFHGAKDYTKEALNLLRDLTE